MGYSPWGRKESDMTECLALALMECREEIRHSGSKVWFMQKAA